MISKELEHYLIAQFNKQKAKCLKTVKKFDNKPNVRYLEQAIMSDAMGFISVRYDLEEKRFTELFTEVVNDKGKSRFETVKLPVTYDM